MPIDSYVQLSPDGSGKQVDMDQVSTAAGASLYRQRAVLVGETGDVLQQLLEETRKQTNILIAIYRVLATANPEHDGVDVFNHDLVT